MHSEPKFYIGQVVHHRRFGYRGVVFDVDPEFSLSEAWYEQVAQSRPPKDRPWYHVIPERSEHTTYVAERNLEPDDSGEPVENAALDEMFEDFQDGAYVSRAPRN